MAPGRRQMDGDKRVDDPSSRECELPRYYTAPLFLHEACDFWCKNSTSKPSLLMQVVEQWKLRAKRGLRSQNSRGRCPARTTNGVSVPTIRRDSANAGHRPLL